MAHGIMFHHFHSDSHSPRPGSISADDLDRMIGFLRERLDILSPEDFHAQALAGTLAPTATVLTFDDALQSQLDLALPVLEDNNIRGIFSVYSSVFSAQPDPLEVFASFRADFFDDFDEFWGVFQDHTLARGPFLVDRMVADFQSDYLGFFPFYSDSERRFRFLRDEIMGPDLYKATMWSLIESTPGFHLEEVVAALWMKPDGLKTLVSGGHAVGLHSHSHPTRMDRLPEQQQKFEYSTNMNWVESNLGVSPEFVAHPCGQYSRVTLDVLDELGIRVGFRSSLTPGRHDSLLEFPREDHSNVMREMGTL